MSEGFKLFEYDDKKKTGSNSFMVNIYFRQHHSWQGQIVWFERKTTRSFRSLLEMIMLIEEALDTAEGFRRDNPLRSWFEQPETLAGVSNNPE